ncbi:MAG TPA: iron-sulfur cluster-binding protein [Peptococcaceae bacterium]|nr:iron-sulfur cluster-binding protein [Peptococcaceae bacterium]
MSKSKVWYAKAGAVNWAESLICKAKDLFYEAGLDKCISPGDSVAIKIHMGEWNRTACLRPEFVAAIVEEVKACGGNPFVTDSTCLSYHLYISRATELHYLKTAYRHGFTPDALGCPVVIADGYVGNDDVRVEIPEGNILKETYIGRAIAAADAMIILTHCKGHPITSFGGAIKNIGIGAQSKRGKYCTHLAMWGDPADAIGYPLVNVQNCRGLECPWHELCVKGCPEGAITIDEKGLHFDYSKCMLCYSCQVTCMFTGEESIGFKPDYFPYAQIAMADAALGCLKLFDKEKVGCLSYIVDVCPECDCFPWSGVPVCPDLGVLASKDPVAIDTAAVDLIDNAPIMPGSRAEELGLKPGDDKFAAVNLVTPRIQLRAAQKIGMGSMDYELIEYEPVLTPENIGKWQIEKEPTTLVLKKVFQYGHPAREAVPFKRVKLSECNWHDFE